MKKFKLLFILGIVLQIVNPSGIFALEEVPQQGVVSDEPSSIAQVEGGLAIGVSVHGVYTINFDVVDLQSEEKIKVALWSSRNGQDDLHWYDANIMQRMPAGNATITFNISDMKDLGEFKMHVYSESSDGSMRFLKEFTYEFDETIVASTTITALDTMQGTANVEVRVTNTYAGVKSVYIPVWSKGDQSDIVWYKATHAQDNIYTATIDVKNHGFNLGAYQVHTYVENLHGNSMNTNMQTVELQAELSNLQVQDVTQKEEQFELFIEQGINTQFSAINYAVWSNVGGQDDIVWSTMQKEVTGFSGTIDIKNHKSLGEYQVHAYGVNANGTLTFIGSTIFSVNTTPELTTQITPTSDGFRVLVNVSGGKSATNKVLIPIWTDANQKDIIWYEATQKDASNYEVNVSLIDHANMFSVFNIHTYVEMNNGITALGASDTYESSLSVQTFAAQQKASNVSISMIGEIEMFEEVHYAIWSATNNQSDLKWVKTNQNNGVANTNINFSSLKYSGNYIVHAYGIDANGKYHYIGDATFNYEPLIKTPTTSTVVDMIDATVSVQLDGVNMVGTAHSASVAVWSKSDQSDLYWYPVSVDANGNSNFIVDLSKHDYNVGKFHMHVYYTNAFNTSSCFVSEGFEVMAAISRLSIDDVYQDESVYRITLDNAYAHQYKDMRVAVWSDAGGQDDLVWYDMQNINTLYNVDVHIKDHKSLGSYQVHVYSVNANGGLSLVEKSSFSVDKVVTTSTTIQNVNGSTGTFEVQIVVNEPVSSMVVPIWSSHDQSDIKWYTPTKVNENTYVVQVDVANHKYNFGNYKVHTYVTMLNQVQVNTEKNETQLTAHNYIKAQLTSTSTYTLSLFGDAGYDNVLYAVWSDVDGQDDLRWYTGDINHSFSTSFNSSIHSDLGQYNIHAYTIVNDEYQLINTTTIIVDDGWHSGTKIIQDIAKDYANSIGRDLLTLFEWTSASINYQAMDEHIIPQAGFSREEAYAFLGFSQGVGNCYTYAAVFAAFARELGYDATYIEGEVQLTTGWARHSYVEIRINGAVYICDPEAAKNYPKYNFYMQPSNDTTLNYRK